MRYEVRYIVNSDEQREIVDVDTAADAVEAVRSQHPDPAENFELIQVQLLDDPTAPSPENALEQA